LISDRSLLIRGNHSIGRQGCLCGSVCSRNSANCLCISYRIRTIRIGSGCHRISNMLGGAFDIGNISGDNGSLGGSLGSGVCSNCGVSYRNGGVGGSSLCGSLCGSSIGCGMVSGSQIDCGLYCSGRSSGRSSGSSGSGSLGCGSLCACISGSSSLGCGSSGSCGVRSDRRVGDRNGGVGGGNLCGSLRGSGCGCGIVSGSQIGSGLCCCCGSGSRCSCGSGSGSLCSSGLSANISGSGGLRSSRSGSGSVCSDRGVDNRNGGVSCYSGRSRLGSGCDSSLSRGSGGGLRSNSRGIVCRLSGSRGGGLSRSSIGCRLSGGGAGSNSLGGGLGSSGSNRLRSGVSRSGLGSGIGSNLCSSGIGGGLSGCLGSSAGSSLRTDNRSSGINDDLIDRSTASRARITSTVGRSNCDGVIACGCRQRRRKPASSLIHSSVRGRCAACHHISKGDLNLIDGAACVRRSTGDRRVDSGGCVKRNGWCRSIGWGLCISRLGSGRSRSFGIGRGLCFGSSLSGSQHISLGGNLISNLGNDRIDNRRRCRAWAGIHGKRRSRRNRFNGARQHHKTGAAIGTVGVAASIQAGSRLLEELIQAIAIVDCADDAVDFGAAGQDGIVQGIQGIGGQEFVVKGDGLQPLDQFQAAIGQ